MGRLKVFNFMSLNGCYKGHEGDISWHNHGPEGTEYSEKMLRSCNILLFGRITYGMMESFWPTAQASHSFPAVAKGMNQAKKVVFSTTLQDAAWNNTTIMKGDIIEGVRRLKETEQQDLVLLGSGSILTQFAEHNLIDEYQFMIDPIAISNGTPIFWNISKQIHLRLVDTNIFTSGVVLLTYQQMPPG